MAKTNYHTEANIFVDNSAITEHYEHYLEKGFAEKHADKDTPTSQAKQPNEMMMAKPCPVMAGPGGSMVGGPTAKVPANAQAVGVKWCFPIGCFIIDYDVQPGTVRLASFESWDIQKKRWDPIPLGQLGPMARRDVLRRLGNLPNDKSPCFGDDCECTDMGFPPGNWSAFKQRVPIQVIYELPGVLAPRPKFRAKGVATVRFRFIQGMCQ